MLIRQLGRPIKKPCPFSLHAAMLNEESVRAAMNRGCYQGRRGHNMVLSDAPLSQDQPPIVLRVGKIRVDL